jgi:hypothetical protein
MSISPIASQALSRIITLRKYPLPQSPIAEQRILKSLNVTDFAAVVEALERLSPKAVTNV